MLYSVVIRSLGNPQYLNKNIEVLLSQLAPPSEIVVVLPDGVELSNEIQYRDYIKLCHSPKGMVSQRAAGILFAQYDLAILLDDDVVLNQADATLRLLTCMRKFNAQCILPYDYGHLDEMKSSVLHSVLECVFLIAVPTRKKSLTYTLSGGYYFPTLRPSLDEAYPTEGGRGNCIAVDRKWLESKNVIGDLDFEFARYALKDDGAFVYDIVLHGGKAYLVSGVGYKHIGIHQTRTSERLYWKNVSSVLNNYIFWEKYIYTNTKRKAVSLILFFWTLLGEIFFCFLRSAKNKNYNSIFGIVEGFRLCYSYSKKGLHKAKVHQN